MNKACLYKKTVSKSKLMRTLVSFIAVPNTAAVTGYPSGCRLFERYSCLALVSDKGQSVCVFAHVCARFYYE